MSQSDTQNPSDDTRCGFVAIIGAPNAGKSTLINAVVGGKISIVSSKVQTTRTRVLGIVAQGNAQMIFVDTPGIFQPSARNRMERAIVAAAWSGMEDTDVVLLMVDATKGYSRAVRPIIERLSEMNDGRKYVLVLNKIDEVHRPKLLELSLKLNEAFSFAATFMISARKGDGVGDLLRYLAAQMPQGPWHYPEDQMSDMPMRLMAAETTREKLFRAIHEEIPYELTVETESWEEFDDGSVKIDQVVILAREGQKKIVIGKGGSMLKKVGEQARLELEEFMGRRVHLKLFVKVREDWINDKEHYALWGLDADA